MEESQAIAPTSKAPKSPPMAFQMTSNDSLSAPMYPHQSSQMAFHSPQYIFSPGTQQKLEYHLDDPMQQELQAQIQKQAEALRLQHQAFAVERECWDLERDRLYRRIVSLEGLLKAANGHSPARSPIASPYNGMSTSQSQQSQFQSHASPLVRPSTTSTTSRLPSIVEDEPTMQSPELEKSCLSLSRQSSITRRGAPSFIELPGGQQIPTIDGNIEEPSITTSEQGYQIPSAGPALPKTPPATRNTLSPPPPEYRTNAGHTPLKVPDRPLSLSLLSPARSTFSEPNTDTPTRNNTELNANLVDEEDEDEALKGPLHMPELPNTPGEENFTIDMLTARLRNIEEHPEENEPLALHAHCNLAESVPDAAAGAAQTAPTDTEESGFHEDKLGRRDFEGLSTISEERVDSTTVTSPPTLTNEPDLDRGIKLKKKASCNFGTPFGQLGPRKF